jgi:hypothetical protein
MTDKNPSGTLEHFRFLRSLGPPPPPAPTVVRTRALAALL